MEQLINNFGFPITVAIVCGTYIIKMQQQQREDSNRREERMFEQMGNITNTLTNINTSLEVFSANTNATLEIFSSRIEKLEGQHE